MGNSQSVTRLQLQLVDPGKEMLRCAEQGNTSGMMPVVACNLQYLSHSSVFGGNTIWHKAAKSGKVQVFEALEHILTQAFQLSQESKDLTDKRFGIRRLGSSAQDAIKRMINKPNLKGMTPLMLACIGSHTEAVAWLLKHGADAWKRDRMRRQTALHCAAQSGATDAIRYLLANAGDELDPVNGKTLLEQGNHAGLTALHYAVYNDQLEVIQQLLAHNADITAQAEFPDLDWTSVNAGDTVMHTAAGKGSIDAIQLLLRAYNEMSGALIPDTGLPRRVRDPRAMRNDYGRLPYHLAMRKGFSWLAELLDPSIPVRYLLAGENLVSGTTWGPPRLATIAAAVLHQSLVADLKNIKELTKADAAAAVKVAITAKVAGAAESDSILVDVDGMLAAYCNSPAQDQGAQLTTHQCQVESQQQDMPGDSASSQPTAGVDSSASSGTQRRRWSLTGQHRRSLSGGRGSNRAAATEQGASRPPSRRSLGSLGHSRRGSRGQGDFGPPPSPLSPRMLMSVMLGNATTGAANPDQQLSDYDEKNLDKAMPLDEPPLSPKQLAAPQEAVRTDAVREPGQQQREVFSQRSSSSPCEPDDEVHSCWESDEVWAVASIPAAGLRPAANACSQQPSARAETLLDMMFRKYTWSSCVESSTHRLRDESEGEDSRTCGVCLEDPPTACILPCNHCMCAGCALDMLERFSLSTAVCPFCRCIIRGFGPTNLATLASMPATLDSAEYLKEL